MTGLEFGIVVCQYSSEHLFCRSQRETETRNGTRKI
jgi:hypothetical protein